MYPEYLMRHSPVPLLFSLLAWCAVVGQAKAATYQIAAGKTLDLKADLVLAGADVLEVQGTADKRCTIQGNDFRIRTAPGWRGQVSLLYCDIRGLEQRNCPPWRSRPSVRASKSRLSIAAGTIAGRFTYTTPRKRPRGFATTPSWPTPGCR